MDLLNRKKSRPVKVGGLTIGGGSPIVIQSMTNTDTRDIEATVRQIDALAQAGCELVRVSVPNMDAAVAVGDIKKRISVPLVCDIHFDYRLALAVLDMGIDKLRINPGNIGEISRVKEVVNKAARCNVPIRIGVNSGSLEKDLQIKYGGASAEALVESTLRHVQILEDLNFFDIVVSIKSSSVAVSIAATKLLSQKINYPIHIGITEAGTPFSGTVKSAIGIGALLLKGIGDTIRVSLTSNPVEEIRVAQEILKSLDIRSFGPQIISCPTCGRTKIDIISLAEEIERKCSIINKPIKIAIMGCAVNGPGEASDADLGIAGGDGCALLFKHGKIIKKVPEYNIVDTLMDEVVSFLNE